MIDQVLDRIRKLVSYVKLYTRSFVRCFVCSPFLIRHLKVALPFLSGRPVYWFARIPHLSLIWWWYRFWLYITAHGTSVC